MAQGVSAQPSSRELLRISTIHYQARHSSIFIPFSFSMFTTSFPSPDNLHPNDVHHDVDPGPDPEQAQPEPEWSKTEQQQQKQQSDAEDEVKIRDLLAEDLVFTVKFHPSRPLFVTGSITGTAQLYEVDCRRPSSSSHIQDKNERRQKTRPVVIEQDEDDESGEDDGGSHAESDSIFSSDNFDEDSASESDSLPSTALLPPTLISQYTPHTSSIRSCIFSTSGERLFTVSSDASLVILDVATELKPIFTLHSAHTAAINVICRYDENIVATGDDDGFVQLWDTRTFQKNLKSPASTINRVANARFAKNGKNNKSKLSKQLTPTSASNLSCIMNFAEHGDYVSDLLAMPSDHLLLSTSGDGYLQVYDIRNKKHFAQSEGMQDDLLSLACLEGGRGRERRRIIVGSKESGLHIFKWDYWGAPSDHYSGLASTSVDQILPITSNYQARIPSCTVGTSDGLVRLLTMFPTRTRGFLNMHQEDSTIESMDKSATIRIDGKDIVLLASSGHDGHIKFADITSIEHETWEGENDNDEASDNEELSDPGVEVSGENEEDSDSSSSSSSSENKKLKTKSTNSLKAIKPNVEPVEVDEEKLKPGTDAKRAAMVARLKRKLEEKRKSTVVSSSDSDPDFSSDEDTKRGNRTQKSQPKKKLIKNSFYDGLM